MRPLAVLGILRALDVGAFVIDPKGAVIQANEKAQAFMAELNPDGETTKLPDFFQPFVAEALAQSSEFKEACLHVRRKDRRPFSLFCVPTAVPGGNLVIAYIDLDEFPAPSRPFLRSAFGLTKAEAEVARLIALGRSVSQIAEELGSAVGTVRFQLKVIFAKTHTSRQAELAAILGRSAVMSQFTPNLTQVASEDQYGSINSTALGERPTTRSESEKISQK